MWSGGRLRRVGALGRGGALLGPALFCGRLVGRADVGLAALGVPLVLLRRHGPNARGHVRVVAPAQLGALAGEDGARLPLLAGDLEPGVVRVAWDGVELPAQSRDPPGVRDVLGADL